MLTMREAANEIGVKRQAIFLQMQAGKIKAQKKEGRWLISREEIQNYLKNRYMRKNRCKAGEVSTKEASKILQVPLQRIYYLIRNECIDAMKRGGMIYVKQESLAHAC